MPTWVDVLALIAALASAAAAVAAWRASARANRISERLAAIEAQRRHDELAPSFMAEVRVDWIGAEGTTVNRKLWLRLDGPLALDSVEIRILSDPGDFRPIPGSEVSPADADSQLWTMLRFAPRIDGASDDGDTVRALDLQVDAELIYQLELNPPPLWWGSDREGWFRVRDDLLRLLIICRLGDEEWRLNKRLAVWGESRHSGLGET